MILSARVTNFKSIKNQTIKLSRFNVVVGRNGSGKTNFISAIALLAGLADGSPAEEAIEEVAPMSGELFYIPPHKSEAEFEFQIQVQNRSYRYSYTIAHHKIGGRFRYSIPHEELSLCGDVDSLIYRREREMIFVGQEQKPIPLKVDLDKLMLASYADENVKSVVTTLKGYTFVKSALQDRAGWLMVDSGKPNLDTIDGIAVALFTKDKKRFEQAFDSIQKLLPNITPPQIINLDFLDESDSTDQSESPQKNSTRYVVTWREKVFNADDRFSQVSLSHGDRRVIHLILNLYNAEEETFFAVEEIENGMHYGRLSKLMDEFRTQATNRRIQVLFTTHSNEILESISPKEVIFCKKSAEMGTELSHLADKTEYKAIEEELGEEHSAADALNTGLFG